MRPLLPAFLLGAVLATPPASSIRPDPMQFFGEDWDAPKRGSDFPAARAAHDAFLVRLDAVAVEDFEGAHGRVLELGLGGYGARLIGGARDSVSTVVRPSPGRRATSARRFYEHGSDALAVELERPVEAVGFYAIDVGDAGGRLRVTLVGAQGWEEAFLVPHRVAPRGDGRGEGAVLFFGVIAPGQAIRRVELRNVGDTGDGFGYDDLVVGRVPRPIL